MSLLEKISSFVAGADARAARAATQALQACYAEGAVRAQQLRLHAEMAPQEYSAQALSELAAAEDAQVERVRSALRAAGAAPGPVPSNPVTRGLSHWERLVHDLESHRISARRLRELAVHFAEDLPQTAQLFDELCREENTHCERLRVLIARADPQALD